MALVIPPGYSHVGIQLRHDLDPEPWYVTYGLDTTGLAGELEDLGIDQMEAFIGAWGGSMSTQAQITGIDITVGQDGAEPVRAFIAAHANLDGSATGEHLPQNCALLVRKNTGLGGRRNRGRCFLPGILAEGQVSAVGIIAGQDMGTYDSLAQEWLDGINGGANSDATMVLLHSEGISDTPPPSVITSLTCDNVISTQRRRLR